MFPRTRVRQTCAVLVAVLLLTSCSAGGGGVSGPDFSSPQPSASQSRAAATSTTPSTSATASTTASSSASSSPTRPAPARVVGALLASDDFDGAAGALPDTSTWQVLTGGNGWGNDEEETYTARPQNISTDGDGHLVITALREDYTGTDGHARHFTSGRMISSVPVTGGYVEARIELPHGQGLWPAFWTLGQNVFQGVQWPKMGEIDILEAKDDMLHSTGGIHGLGARNTPYHYSFSKLVPGGLTGWHTYGIDWRTDSVTWYLDGAVYGTISRADLKPGEVWPFAEPQLVQFNVAVGGTWPGPTTAKTPDRASMLVDWVKVWSS